MLSVVLLTSSLAWTGTLPAAAAPSTPKIVEASDPGPTPAQAFEARLTAPAQCMTPGPDGRVWALEQSGVVASIGPDLSVVEYPGYGTPAAPPPQLRNGCIAAGPGGAIWYLLNSSTPEIVKLSTSGSVLGHWPLSGAAAAGEVIIGPDGNVWFSALYQASFSDYHLGRITPGGVLTWPLLGPDAQPIRTASIVTVGTRVWIRNNTVGWLGDDLAFHEALPVDGRPVHPMIAGPDGRLWLGYTSTIYRAAEDGRWDSIFIDEPTLSVQAMASALDHTVYIVARRDIIGRLTTDGQLLTLQLAPSSLLLSIASVPNGDVYVSDAATSSVFRLGVSPWVHFLQNFYLDALGRALDPGATTYYTTLWMTGVIPGPSDLSGLIVTSDEYLLARVDRLYRQFLHRAADSDGRAYWAGLLRGGWRAEQLSVALIGSDEYFYGRGRGDIDSYIRSVYVDLLARVPDPEGAQYWHNLLATGSDRRLVASALVYARESLQKIVTDLYLQYLHRVPDSGGLGYWTDRLEGGMTDETLVVLLSGSDEYFIRGLDP